jgi:hypothetical protein
MGEGEVRVRLSNLVLYKMSTEDVVEYLRENGIDPDSDFHVELIDDGKVVEYIQTKC